MRKTSFVEVLSKVTATLAPGEIPLPQLLPVPQKSSPPRPVQTSEKFQPVLEPPSPDAVAVPGETVAWQLLRLIRLAVRAPVTASVQAVPGFILMRLFAAPVNVAVP